MKCAYLRKYDPNISRKSTNKSIWFFKTWTSGLSAIHWRMTFQETIKNDFAKKAIFFDIDFLELGRVTLQNGFQEFCSTDSKDIDVSTLFVVFLSNYKILFLSNYKILFLYSCNFVEWQGNITFQKPLITKK